jgi:hypothetical protein
MEPIISLLLSYYSKNPALKSFIETRDPANLFIYPLEISIEALHFYYKLMNGKYIDLLNPIPYEDYNRLLLIHFTPEVWDLLKQYDSFKSKDGSMDYLLLSIYLNEPLNPNHLYELALRLLNTHPPELRYLILMRYYLYSKLQSTK